jgi:hypothetical protein
VPLVAFSSEYRVYDWLYNTEGGEKLLKLDEREREVGRLMYASQRTTSRKISHST